jgi:hypothetical protein
MDSRNSASLEEIDSFLVSSHGAGIGCKAQFLPRFFIHTRAFRVPRESVTILPNLRKKPRELVASTLARSRNECLREIEGEANRFRIRLLLVREVVPTMASDPMGS